MGQILLPSSELDFKFVEWPSESHNIERRNFHGDNSLFSSNFDWSPSKSFEEGINEFKTLI